ncbi:DUF222 domain-containing protein [Actinomadura sp. HBU206391]|uniref:DUF222 domain-containing protein n=1 Tax=Actinomadura sp. HBU206391 TaxID=2731692 RepID=UPI0016503187|nr:DUF222 domain-containing protein [Actinomadura sp. HBU206391]MBC6462696.1 DUF222 domain-containing protein [Actinomadura sp. HBU206391]
MLADVRLAELSDEELVEVMAASRRQTSWAQEREMSAVAELSRRRHQSENGPAAAGYGHVGIHEIVTEEVSLALTLTATAASVLVVRSEQLAEQLPLTRVALRTGRIDMRRAEVIIDAVRGLDDALAGAVEAAIIAEARALTTGKLRRRVTEAIRAAGPEAARERKKAAVKTAAWSCFPTPAAPLIWRCGIYLPSRPPPHMRISHVQPPSGTLRPRSHDPLAQRRQNMPLQSVPFMSKTPSLEAASRLETAPTVAGAIDLDHAIGHLAYGQPAVTQCGAFHPEPFHTSCSHSCAGAVSTDVGIAVTGTTGRARRCRP